MNKNLCVEGEDEDFERQFENPGERNVGGLQKIYNELARKINDPDLKEKVSHLSIKDGQLRRYMLVDFQKLATINESLLHKKYKNKWIMEGDANAKKKNMELSTRGEG